MMYLVHKQTKEHRRYEDAIDWRDSDCQLILADADGWIEWDAKPGAGCPLPHDADCDVRHEDGFVAHRVPAHKEKWSGVHSMPRCRIVAYRPVLDAKPEAPEWDGGLPPVGIDVHWANADADDQTFTVVAHDEDMVICHNPWDTDSRYIWGYASDFRPIRSEEDRAVEEMLKSVCGGGDYTESLCRALYRAGYRKTAAADGEDV